LDSGSNDCLRASDLGGKFGSGPTLCRLGGDEFGVLLESVQDRTTAELVAQQMLNSLRPAFHLEGREVYASVSIGIALSNVDYQNPEEVLRDSDTAMYNAKLLGGSRMAVFDSEMRSRAIARLRIETDLHTAIKRNEFRLQYQPIISLESFQTIGFEALLRWMHPTLGTIPPTEFVGIAEEVGLMSEIGRWVIFEACREARRWVSRESNLAPYVSVNVSAKHLVCGTLVSEIDRALESFALRAQQLRIEVTETALIADLDAAKEVVLQLKERGILVSIDDFGTGYAGLQYLRRLPVSTLKIDRSFVALMKDGTENFPQAIVTLAHELGLDVVAEGIETDEDAKKLKSMTCESGQGFYFAKPPDPDQITEHLRTPAGRPGIIDAK
jgi:predicted signal transduction protein with EAL and GGDEF domain